MQQSHFNKLIYHDKSDPMPSPDADTSCQFLNRKKRRGMIEKRRRDRINNSLLELRRLVPAAFEKQGSAKLEKAEILQMTVDHLRMLHAKGFDAFSFDPHKFAVDYHSIGFRECASEVARYMVANEGMDLQDPLRLRLMSHLQCYSAQRELSLKTSTGHTGWNPSAFTTPQFPPPLPPGHPSSANHASNIGSLASVSCESIPLHGTVPVPSHYSGANSGHHHHHHHHQTIEGSNGVSSPMMGQLSGGPKSSGSPNPISSSMQSIGYPSTSAPGMSPMGSSHHHYTNSYFPSGYASASAAQAGVSTVSSGIPHPQGASVRHYRPWGAELAY